MLQASGRMVGFILQVEVDVGVGGDREVDQVRVRRAGDIRPDPTDRLIEPKPVVAVLGRHAENRITWP
ncbi:hypothetical protein D3C80_1521460 [compost metagenome]